MSPWLAAKTIGRASRACWYLDRAGVRSFHPVVHRYYLDRRTRQEKFRVAELFPGYLFIRPEGPLEYAKAKNAIGVAYILGGFSGERFVPREIPAEWVETLEKAGPVLVGKRRKFVKGQKIRVVISNIAEIVATVEAHNGHKVKFRTDMFGAEVVADADESRVELQQSA